MTCSFASACSRVGLMSFASLIALGFAGEAFAAGTASPSAAPAALEEIVVTAQRREESLRDVPVSVTALTGERLAALQVTNLTSFMANVPNLKVKVATYGTGDLNLAIRGVRTQGSIINLDSAVGIYVDGVYYARSADANVAFVDMERVEVLRGPQGTLFGRNTIGGALNIITAPPTDRFEGSIKVGVGNYSKRTLNVVLNAPLIEDKLDMRLVYDHQQHDGYVKAITKPLVGPSGFNDQNQEYARVTFKAHPTDNIDLQLMVDHLDIDQHSMASVLSYFDPTGVSAATSISKPTTLITDAQRARIFSAVSTMPMVFNTWRTNDEFNPKNQGRTSNFIFTGNVNLGFGTLTSITGYHRLNFNMPTDLDAVPFTTSETYDYSLIGTSFSQEVQLSGKSFNDRLNWIGGVYYFREKNSQDTNNLNPPATGPLTSAFDANGQIRPGSTLNPSALLNAVNKSESIYAHVSYEIVPGVRLVGGARHVEDHRGATYFSELMDALSGAVSTCGNLTAAGLATVAGGCRYTPATVKFSYTPWDVGVDYKPTEDALIYGKISKGFRSGGLQQCCGASLFAFTPFGPESVVSYEGGTKLSLMEHRLQINGAIFYSKYDDIQQTVPTINPLTNSVVGLNSNVGKAEIKGGELEVTALVGPLRLNGSLGITHPKFTGGPFKGTIYPGNPKTSLAFGADYPIETGVGALVLHADYDWQSSSYLVTPIFTSVAPGQPFLDIYSAQQKASLRENSQGYLNAVASLALRTQRPVTLSIWGRNLTKTFSGTPFAQAISGPNFWGNRRPNDPRTFGATAQVKF